MKRTARQIALLGLILALCLLLPLSLLGCDQTNGETTGGSSGPLPSPTAGTGSQTSATETAPSAATTTTVPSTALPTATTATASTSAATANAPSPTAAPSPTRALSPTPASTLNVLRVLNGAFVRMQFGDYMHITVRDRNTQQEYDFWVLKDTGVTIEDLVEGDLIKVTWRTTLANIPEAGGSIKIDEAVKIEFTVPPPKLNTLNCTFVGLTPGDYLHMTVKELNTTKTRDFWVLHDTGIRPQDLKPGDRIIVTWRNVDLRIPETIEKLNVNEAVRIEYRN